MLSSTWSEIFKIVPVSCLRNEAILARVVEFDTFNLSTQEPLGWSEVYKKRGKKDFDLIDLQIEKKVNLC